jgi:hypothetical protein
MNQEHGQGQEGTTVGVRGSESGQGFHPHTHGGEAFAGSGARLGTKLLELNRKDSEAGIGNLDPFGGVIDQLIDDARKQLIKSQECIVWYREEAKEYQQKLDNLIKLKELQLQQQQQMKELQQLQQQQQLEASNNSEESLAE